MLLPISDLISHDYIYILHHFPNFALITFGACITAYKIPYSRTAFKFTYHYQPFVE